MSHSPEFEALCADALTRVRETTLEEVLARDPASFELIDVREDHEWAVDHMPGARHLGRGILERDILALIPDKDREIVLYCGGGYRSALAADNLQKMGYKRVFSMKGGIKAWRARPPVDPARAGGRS